ncbi:PREDICTED: uncharacterized protein At4g22160 [Tarenaya hassleriana]|uniref:uncharacterized protein At4g22160 n=1 Tax=Tarenaya hassleriana TaxID=28532 RepID=UPI00053C5682|nr:PREDICTED: uncharacterized protein At4g22160 [Tarenaya hassleriana]
MAKPPTFRQSRRSQTASASMGHVSEDGFTSDNDGSNVPKSSDEVTQSSMESRTESSQGSDTQFYGITASIRLLSDSLLRMEVAEMEMAKAREAARREAEKRRLEMETELTRMVMQTHLKAVPFGGVGSKRKRSSSSSSVQEQEASTSTSTRDLSLSLSLLFFSLLQLNLIFWNSQA